MWVFALGLLLSALGLLQVTALGHDENQCPGGSVAEVQSEMGQSAVRPAT